MAFTSEVIIEAPIEEVFEVISTYKYSSDALGHIVNVEKITDGPVAVGTEFMEKRHVRNMNISNKLVVSEYEKNKRFAIKSKQHKLLLNYEYTFSETDEGHTKVNFIGKIKTKGIKNYFYRPLINGMMKREDGNHVELLKEYIEKKRSGDDENNDSEEK